MKNLGCPLVKSVRYCGELLLLFLYMVAIVASESELSSLIIHLLSSKLWASVFFYARLGLEAPLLIFMGGLLA